MHSVFVEVELSSPFPPSVEGFWISMKGSFTRKSQRAGNAAKAGNAEEGTSAAEWELRPCGMLVQKRDPDAEAAHAGPLIRVKVVFGRSSVRVPVNSHSTFGDLKKVLVQDTGLQIKRQRLLYKGKEKSDRDYLFEAGVKDKSKIVLVEDTRGWEKTLVEMRKSDADAKACEAVAEVQKLVDQVSGQVAALKATVSNGKKLTDNELVDLTDILMAQLIKLDDSKVDGETKTQKRILIRRVQKYVETLDALKVINERLKIPNGSMRTRDARANGNAKTTSPQTDITTAKIDPAKLQAGTASMYNTTVVTTTWETFGNCTSNGIVNKPASSSSEPMLIQWD